MLLQALRRLFGPRTLADPVFGSITFVPNPAYPAWRGECDFPPVAKRVAVQVHAGQAGPGKAQRDVYGKIIERWPEISAAAAKQLAAFDADVLEKEGPADVWATYSLAEIHVPRRNANLEWRLGFDSTDDPGHVYFVEFEGWTATGEVRPEG